MAPTLNQDDIKLLKGIFATKDDLKDFAKKDDLKAFATKDDVASVKSELASMEARFDKKFATKDDLTSMETRFDKKFATKEDLKKVISASEKKIIKRVDFMINVLDRDHVKLAREVNQIKIHVGIPISN